MTEKQDENKMSMRSRRHGTKTLDCSLRHQSAQTAMHSRISAHQAETAAGAIPR